MTCRQLIKSNRKGRRQTPLSVRSSTSRHPLIQLQKTVGNQAVERIAQAKLRVSRPGDYYEHEADRIAEFVMGMPEGVPFHSATPSSPHVQRQCAECASGKGLCPKCEEENAFRSVDRSGGHLKDTSQVDAGVEGLNGGGQPLPDSVRAFFEPRFGQDFSQVRVHTDAKAAGSARALNARAFTVGQDVVFGVGEYVPGTREGRHLLAHELSHVVQQTSGGKNAIGPQGGTRIQRQPEQERIGPPLPELPSPDVECSVDFMARRWQDFLNCCAQTPLGRGCSSDLIKLAEELSGRGRTRPTPETPPSPCPGRETPFGTCCPDGEMWNGTTCAPITLPPSLLCFPPERRSPDGRTCCEPDQVWDVLGRRCVARPVTPPPPEPTTQPSAVEIFFHLDKPALGEAGDLDASLTSEGRRNLDSLIQQLKDDSTLHVQLVGRASPEGTEEYNLDLGRRRAEMIAAALQAEGIDASRIGNSPGELPSGCVQVRPGLFTCGEAGAQGPQDRQVTAKIFSSR